MATYFGEVLTLSSRAVDDDDDDDESHTQSWIPSPELEWCTEVHQEIEKIKVLPCSTLIVAVGPAASGYAEACILQDNAQRIGCIATGKVDSEGSTLKHKAHSNRESAIYRLTKHPEVIVCQCKQEVLAEQAFVWAQKLFSQIDTTSANILILDSCPVQSYKAAVSMSELETPFIRCLKTAKHSSKQNVPFLESPNTVSGLSAAVLSHCQVHQLPAILYVAFLESVFMDLDSFNVFSQLRNSSPLCDLSQNTDTADNILKKILDERALQDSLYI